MAIDFFKIGQISGKQFTDVSGAVKEGLEAGLKPFVEWKEKKDKFDADYARLLQSTPNIDNLPELPTNYLPKASEWLISKQQEYATNARTTLKARPGSPEYQQAVMNMNNIKSAVANLKANLTGINTERKEFLKAYNTGEISQGFQNTDIYEAYGANGAITTIDANGNVALTGAEGKSFNWNERQEYFTKSGKVQADLFLAGNNALKEGEAGKQRDLTYFTEKSKAIVAQYDLPRIKSLVFDDLDGTDTKLAEDAELVSLINSSKPNLPEIREALAGKLGQAMFDVNKTGFKTYSDKQKELTERTKDPIDKLGEQRAQGKKRFKDTLTDINTAFSRKNKEYFINKKFNGKPIDNVAFKRDENNNPIAVFDVVVSTAGGQLTTNEIIIPYKRGEVIKDLTTTFVKNQFGSDAITDYGLEQYDQIVDELRTARAAKKIRNTDYSK
jgi:hypothetical protein